MIMQYLDEIISFCILTAAFFAALLFLEGVDND